jgi:hypothetical protein
MAQRLAESTLFVAKPKTDARRGLHTLGHAKVGDYPVPN